MGIQIIGEKGNSLSFILTDASVSIANSLRRAAIAEVPTLAIEEVEFYDNTSSLYDEILAHRLSLIPIVTDLNILNFRDKCTCKDGCPSCQLELTLKKKGPGSVHSQDLKSSNKKLSPVPGILIAKLGKNQNIALNAKAVLGRGKENTRWQSAVVGYKYHPIIEISKECLQCGDCAEACPRNVFEFKKEKLKVVSEKDCILCRACIEACDQGTIKVTGDESRFIYEMESTGSLKPREIFTRACDVLAEKAKDLRSQL
jgi:DNA-directed RNA polymerase subunit D